MIHYHGTPIGGSRQDAARFLVGRHALVPFLRQDDLAAVLECSQSFMLDNSAFSHWKSGRGQVDFEAYCIWVDSLRWHPGFDFCLIPDVIDGVEADNRALVNQWLTRWHGPAAFSVGAPVWHLHESLEWLAHLVRVFPVVAFGSSGEFKTPGSTAWRRRMEEAMGVACDAEGRPKCRLHGLRMLSVKVFTDYPFRSADSTNASVNSGALDRYGMYPPVTRAQRAAVIADRVEAYNAPAQYVFAMPAILDGPKRVVLGEIA
jgi:hypothetical protein